MLGGGSGGGGGGHRPIGGNCGSGGCGGGSGGKYNMMENLR